MAQLDSVFDSPQSGHPGEVGLGVKFQLLVSDIVPYPSGDHQAHLCRGLKEGVAYLLASQTRRS